MIKTNYEVWAFVSNGPDDGGEWEEQATYSNKRVAFKEAAHLEIRGGHVAIVKTYESKVGETTSRSVQELYDSERVEEYELMRHLKNDVEWESHNPKLCEACVGADRVLKEAKKERAEAKKRGIPF